MVVRPVSASSATVATASLPGTAHDGSRPLQQADLAACRVDTPRWSAGKSRRSASAQSRLCGRRITIDLKLDGDVITDYAQEVRACVIGQAVASGVGQVITGMTIDKVVEDAGVPRAVLQEKAFPPSGPWDELEPFLPVSDLRSRHGSALLPFEALQRAIREADPGRNGQVEQT